MACFLGECGGVKMLCPPKPRGNVEMWKYGNVKMHCLLESEGGEDLEI